MSTFSDEFVAAAWPDQGTYFGRTVTATPPVGDASDITMKWHYEGSELAYGEGGAQRVHRGRGVVNPADLAADPDNYTFTIDGVVYAVESIGQRLPLLELTLVSRRDDEVMHQQHRVAR